MFEPMVPDHAESAAPSVPATRDPGVRCHHEVTEMYRDEPFDDELELRTLVGDHEVDALDDDQAAVETALDVMRLLQGWVDDDQAASWLTEPARRLDDRSPLTALADGDHDDVVDACQAFIAAQG